MLRAMVRRSLTKPTKPEVISDAEAKRLVKKHEEMAEERRELYRLADAKTKALDAQEALLAIYVDAKKTSRARTINLGKFRLSIIQKQKNLYYKQQLIDEIGEEEFNRRVNEQPTYDKLEIEAL